MPGLDTELHVNMLHGYDRRSGLVRRVWRALRKSESSRAVYGLHWGDPESSEPLRFVRDRYLLPYIDSNQQAVEIGPGGGRWTRYLREFQKLYVVDYYVELLNELKRNFNLPNMVYIKNNGTDFPGVPPQSIDFVFAFGVFVHLDTPLIEVYLKNLRTIVKPGANLVIHYSDQTKIMAQLNNGFSDNNPDKMRALVKNTGYKIVEEDLTTMWHSSIMRLTP